MKKILVMPPFGLPKLMAIYCVWEEDRRAGGRAVVSFQPVARHRTPAREEFLVDGATVLQILHQSWATGNQRWKILIDYCQATQPPYALDSLAHTLEELSRRLKPLDERLWIAFMQIANRVLTGNLQLLHRGSREVLGQDPFFRQRLYSPPPTINGVEFRQPGRLLVALVNTPDNHLANRLFRETPAAAVISVDPRTHQATIQLRVHGWRPPIDLKRLRQHLPPEEPWRLARFENLLICERTNLDPQQLLRAFDRASSSNEAA